MSKQTDNIRAKFRAISKQEVGQMGPDGLALAGIAVLLESVRPVSSRSRDVEKFHEKFFIHYTGEQRFLPADLDIFRNNRTYEELDEYNSAKTLTEKLDALIDLMYIIDGTLHCHGFTPETIDEAWRRVHKANMAKERASEKNPGKHGDKRDIVKPEGWEHPDLSDLVIEPEPFDFGPTPEPERAPIIAKQDETGPTV